MIRALTTLGVLLGGCFGAGSSSDPPAAEPRCVDQNASETAQVLGDACTPAYEPTFEQVFARTLQPSCGKAGGTCHASTGNQGGLTFEDLDGAYQALSRGGHVKAGDPSCSPLMVVLESSDRMERMPPAGRLPFEERCAIARWIAAGAAGPAAP